MSGESTMPPPGALSGLEQKVCRLALDCMEIMDGCGLVAPG